MIPNLKGNAVSKKPVIRSQDLDSAELAWFAPICNDDFRHLGVFDDQLKSTFKHASSAVLEAEKQGFGNILCPSSYQVGQDTLAFGSALAPMIQKIQLLLAIRCGEVHPPMLARAISTLDHILKGRLTINIISSDLPGEVLDSDRRYRRSAELLEILHQSFLLLELRLLYLIKVLHLFACNATFLCYGLRENFLE